MLPRIAAFAAATQAFTAPRPALAPRTRRPRTAPVYASASDVFEVATGAFDWTCNLGAPAALVAGAVMATTSEYKDDESLVTREGDHKWVRQAKKMIKVLLCQWQQGLCDLCPWQDDRKVMFQNIPHKRDTVFCK